MREEVHLPFYCYIKHLLSFLQKDIKKKKGEKLYEIRRRIKKN